MYRVSLNKGGQWSLEPLEKGSAVAGNIGADKSDMKPPVPTYETREDRRNKKVNFNKDADQKGFIEYVKHRADHIPSSGFAVGKVEDFVWMYMPEYDVKNTNQIKRDWVSWYDGELDEWRYDRGDERAGHFEEWAKNPSAKPAIIIEGTDGKPHIWDGHHRVGMAHIKKMNTLPVLYGVRNKKK